MIVKFSDWQLALVIRGIRHEACLLSGVKGGWAHGAGGNFELEEVNAHRMCTSATNKQ